MLNKIRRLLDKFPYVRGLAHDVKVYKKGFPPGHFYSPIVNTEEVKEERDRIFGSQEIKDLYLNEDEQWNLLGKFKEFYSDLKFNETKTNGLQYYYENETYSYSDAIFLYSMIRNFSPGKIIEVGSGFSSAVMTDTNRLYFDSKIEIVHVEPYPYHLRQAYGDDYVKLNLIEKKVQHVSLDVFQSLKVNDILFIDSTHVSKTGSDLNYIIFNVLPSLQPGVFIHFHDVFYPFEYPEASVMDQKFHKNGFGWNEIYMLRAFLMNNNDYKIVAFNTLLEEKDEGWFAENMPLCLKNKGGSIWLKKIN